MVQEAFTYVEKLSNLEVKLKLIDTLRTVTAGKVNLQNSYIDTEKFHFSYLKKCYLTKTITTIIINL